MMCNYCGEEEATERIPNPNFDDEPEAWEVCLDCKDTIAQQQKLSFGMILQNEVMINEARAEIEKIAKRTKKPILNVVISKKDDGSYQAASMEFTGK